MSGDATFIVGDRHFGRFTRTARENGDAVRDARSALAAADSPAAALEASIELGEALTVARQEQEALGLLRAAVEQACHDGSSADARGWALLMLATAEHYADLPHDAELHFAEALAIAHALADVELEHYTLHHQGRFFVDAGDLSRGRESFLTCLQIRDRLGDPRADRTRRALAALDDAG